VPGTFVLADEGGNAAAVEPVYADTPLQTGKQIKTGKNDQRNTGRT